VAAGAALVHGGVAFVGADLATRLQYAIMSVLTAGLVPFFAGGLALCDGERLAGGLAAPAGALGFWPLFALFFPAVTGFTQGVSMSGDLRDPSRSLPGGTLAAVGLSAAVYAGAMLVFAAALPGDVLRSDYAAMRRVAALPALVDAGLMAAALSSALASFLGAPRILQALAADGVFPLLAPFAHGYEAKGNPRRGVLLVGAIALAIDPLAKVVALALLGVVHQYLKRTAIPTAWRAPTSWTPLAATAARSSGGYRWWRCSARGRPWSLARSRRRRLPPRNRRRRRPERVGGAVSTSRVVSKRWHPLLPLCSRISCSVLMAVGDGTLGR